MAHIALAPEDPIVSFERGIDREQPRTAIEKGGYEDAQNIILSKPSIGGKHVNMLNVDGELDAAIVWEAGNAIFVAPFSFATFSGGVLTFSSHLVIARDTGAVWRYDSGAPGTQTLVRRGFSTDNDLWTDTVYDQWLITLNQRDAPMKYGQHFLAQGEARPFMFPVGSKPVSPMGATITDENWTFSSANSSFVADASVPNGSRVHTQSVKVDGGDNAFNSWTAAKNFLSGPFPYGGTDFAGSDFLVFQVMKNSGGAANVRIRFGNDANTAFFEFTQSVSDSPNWQTFRLLRSAASTTGSPVWSSIKRVTFFNDDTAGDEVYFDDVYFLYANAPPAAQVGAYHKTRLIVAAAPIIGDDTPITLANIFWSRAAFPDEFPAANTQVVSSGSTALAKTNEITALREFGASLLVGSPHSLTAWTLDGNGNPQQQLITNAHGVDSPRGIAETPNGALLFFWQRGIYVLRSTWRAIGSAKIQPFIKDVWLGEPKWTVAIFDEKTQTVRFWFREKTNGDPAKTTSGLIFDYVRAQELGEAVWPSKMTQLADFAAITYINGVREVIYGRYDSQDLFRLGNTTGTLTGFITLPWMSREGADRIVKWLGLVVPYAASAPVDVKIRYASNPEEFDAAVFENVQTLPAAPGITQQARVLFGKPSRWAQVRFEAASVGFELFPPIEMIAVPTKRVP